MEYQYPNKGQFPKIHIDVHYLAGLSFKDVIANLETYGYGSNFCTCLSAEFTLSIFGATFRSWNNIFNLDSIDQPYKFVRPQKPKIETPCQSHMVTKTAPLKQASKCQLTKSTPKSDFINSAPDWNWSVVQPIICLRDQFKWTGLSTLA